MALTNLDPRLQLGFILEDGGDDYATVRFQPDVVFPTISLPAPEYTYISITGLRSCVVTACSDPSKYRVQVTDVDVISMVNNMKNVAMLYVSRFRIQDAFEWWSRVTSFQGGGPFDIFRLSWFFELMDRIETTLLKFFPDARKITSEKTDDVSEEDQPHEDDESEKDQPQVDDVSEEDDESEKDDQPQVDDDPEEDDQSETDDFEDAVQPKSSNEIQEIIEKGANRYDGPPDAPNLRTAWNQVMENKWRAPEVHDYFKRVVPPDSQQFTLEEVEQHGDGLYVWTSDRGPFRIVYYYGEKHSGEQSTKAGESLVPAEASLAELRNKWWEYVKAHKVEYDEDKKKEVVASFKHQDGFKRLMAQAKAKNVEGKWRESLLNAVRLVAHGYYELDLPPDQLPRDLPRMPTYARYSFASAKAWMKHPTDPRTISQKVELRLWSLTAVDQKFKWGGWSNAMDQGFGWDGLPEPLRDLSDAIVVLALWLPEGHIDWKEPLTSQYRHTIKGGGAPLTVDPRGGFKNWLWSRWEAGWKSGSTVEHGTERLVGALYGSARDWYYSGDLQKQAQRVLSIATHDWSHVMDAWQSPFALYARNMELDYILRKEPARVFARRSIYDLCTAGQIVTVNRIPHDRVQDVNTHETKHRSAGIGKTFSHEMYRHIIGAPIWKEWSGETPPLQGDEPAALLAHHIIAEEMTNIPLWITMKKGAFNYVQIADDHAPASETPTDKPLLEKLLSLHEDASLRKELYRVRMLPQTCAPYLYDVECAGDRPCRGGDGECVSAEEVERRQREQEEAARRQREEAAKQELRGRTQECMGRSPCGGDGCKEITHDGRKVCVPEEMETPGWLSWMSGEPEIYAQFKQMYQQERERTRREQEQMTGEDPARIQRELERREREQMLEEDRAVRDERARRQAEESRRVEELRRMEREEQRQRPCKPYVYQQGDSTYTTEKTKYDPECPTQLLYPCRGKSGRCYNRAGKAADPETPITDEYWKHVDEREQKEKQRQAAAQSEAEDQELLELMDDESDDDDDDDWSDLEDFEDAVKLLSGGRSLSWSQFRRALRFFR